MPPVVINLAPSTETEAVNLMLRQIGEQPVVDATVSTLADVLMALDILKETTRESLSEGWKFNTEFGLRLNPAAGSPMAWTDADGTVQSLNIFVPPTGLLAFSVTRSVAQQNPMLLDLVLRKSKVYNIATVLQQVFYDRSNNRDGLPVSEFTFIHIDPVWYMNYEDLPQEMRRYIAIRAARIFTQNVPGNEKLSQFTSDDEIAALRQVKRRHGQVDKYNMFDNAHNAGSLGFPYRSFNAGGVRDLRTNP